MSDCPDIIARLDRLALACRKADDRVWQCIHGRLATPLWEVQQERDRAEAAYHQFRDDHGLAVCLSMYDSAF